MPDHLEFSRHMKGAEFDGAIRETFLGQAHIAGTGPEGKTCRECVHWCVIRTRKDGRGNYATVYEPPGYNGERHKSNPLELRRAGCQYPIANKARKRIPHNAKACRFFEDKPTPPPIFSEPKRKRTNGERPK